VGIRERAFAGYDTVLLALSGIPSHHQLPAGNLVEDDSEGVQLRRDPVSSCCGHLGRHPRKGGLCSHDSSPIVEPTCEVVINQPSLAHVRGQSDVVGFDVAMGKPRHPVDVIECRQQLHRNLNNLASRRTRPPAKDNLTSIEVSDLIHHERDVSGPGWLILCLVDAGDRRMVELAE
jgi:hypothetical protein